MRWRIYPVVTTLLILLACSAVFSLIHGAMGLPALASLQSVVDAVAGTQFSALETYEQVVVVELRLPRLLLAMLVGALLAQCGAVMQGLFRNPLADPGVIGVSSGAAVGAIIAIVWWVDALGFWVLPVSAFTGGLLTTLFVYALAQSTAGTSVLFLLLAGIAISAFAGSAIGLMSYFSNDQQLRDLSLWQMGSLGSATTVAISISAITLLILMILFQRQAASLNALLLGEAEARHLGIEVEKLKLSLIVLTAVGVGVAVAFTGVIGFVGLVVPHLVRLTTGPNHGSLLPLSALCGALLMVSADLLARIVVQPAELPVGLVTALLGAPFFLALLIQQRKHWGG